MPSPWAWSSFGLGPILQAISFQRSKWNRHPTDVRSQELLISNPCHRHGHGHRSGLGRSRKRSVFVRICRFVTQKCSASKIVDGQSMPPPWAWSSFGFGPSLCMRTVFIRINRIAIQTCSAPKNFDSRYMSPPWT